VRVFPIRYLLSTIDPISCSLIESEATVGRNATFFQSLAFNKDLGATRGIDFVLKAHNLDAIVLPALGLTTTPAGSISLNFANNAMSNGFLLAIAGYPIVTGKNNLVSRARYSLQKFI
jgi:hypothetical protein